MKNWIANAAGAALLSFAGFAGAATQLLVPATAPPGATPKFGIPAATPVRFNLHELKRLAPGAEVQLTLPAAGTHDYIFELSQSHGEGISSWIGRHKANGNEMRAIVTTGPSGSFAVFNTPAGEYRLVPGEGHDWLFETAVAVAAEGATIDLRDDVRIPPPADPKAVRETYAPGTIEAVAGVNVVSTSKATPTPQTVIDLLIVYTNGFATKLGGNLNTRLAFLVTRANTAYADSEIAITLRLVGTTQVTYSDATSTSSALFAITPVRPEFDAAVFGSIETQRTAVGADVVAFLRDGSNNGGNGIAWMAQGAVSAPYMYSVTTGCMASCESVFIHEVGHNMGNNHDRATASWQNDGVPETGGFYPYSFGYVFCKSGALSCNPFNGTGAGSCVPDTQQPECSTNDPSNYSDLMSYFHGTTQNLYKFSNPAIICKATRAGADGVDRPCGVASGSGTAADTALSMNNNRVAIAALKPTVVPLTVPSATALTSSSNPSAVAGSVTLTATVTGTGGTPTGTVAFKLGAVDIVGCAAAAMTAGSAQCATSALPKGVNSITAVYSGSANFNASTSPAIFQTVTSAPPLLSAGPPLLDFGGQSMNTTSSVLTSTFTNSSGVPVLVNGATAYGSGYAIIGNTCITTLAIAATCTVSVAFTPPAAAAGGIVNGTVALSTLVLGVSDLVPVRLTGTAEKSLVSHYYRSILRRAPDAGGKMYWEGEGTRVAGLGANVNETWFAMAQAFYFSAEYAAFNRDNTAFVTDLYNTFFNRAPDAGGLTFWNGQLAAGLPREVALASFMFSTEFGNFTTAIFGGAGTRAEVNTVVDFYRGLLARTPDTGGFNFWVGRFRAAQCQNAAAVTAQVEAISSAYTLSAEYLARGRSNAQYIGDLYNAFLRRGGDLAGVQFWIGQVGGAQTREQVRVQFKNSAEFQARVTAIIAQGCL